MGSSDAAETPDSTLQVDLQQTASVYVCVCVSLCELVAQLFGVCMQP